LAAGIFTIYFLANRSSTSKDVHDNVQTDKVTVPSGRQYRTKHEFDIYMRVLRSISDADRNEEPLLETVVSKPE
jgi:hypothetical protein